MPGSSAKPAGTLPPSAAQFVASVLELKAKLAVFDCDGTLWAGDGGKDFLYWEVERGLLPEAESRWIIPRYEDYMLGNVDEEAMCGEMVTVHRGIAVKKIEAAAEEYIAQVITPRIFPEMRELTRELQAAGCEIWAVSSTNEWVIRAGARSFAIPPEKVLAAAVKVKDGAATGDLIRVPTGEGKARVLREIIRRPVDVVFGNSRHDAAMLALARHAFAIDPDPFLEDVARKNAWTIYQRAYQPA
jgi:HAD superfamily phosphoserine phosphatase-like hydrolase